VNGFAAPTYKNALDAIILAVGGPDFSPARSAPGPHV
jgi:hypothetical protein